MAYVKGTINHSELIELENWKGSSNRNLLLFNELIDEANREKAISTMQHFDTEAALARVTEIIGQKIPSKQPAKLYWYRIVASVAAVLIIVPAVIFLNKKEPERKEQIVQTIQDVAPGRSVATLTLADGTVVALDNQKNGLLTNQGGISIYKESDGRIAYSDASMQENGTIGSNTVSTPKGGQYQVRLPDGSDVWLNAASSITYSNNLKNDGVRRVHLNGEAYFQVAHDARRPFIVQTGKQEVKVLGTHFNINSYSDEQATVTTLIEGSVKVHALIGKLLDKVIKPGEKSMLLHDNLLIREADIETELGWKEGLFVFKDADVPTVMRQISRWYNIEIEYNGAIPKELITGGISRSSNLSTVLKMLEMVQIKYRIVQQSQNKKLIITE